MVRLSEEIIQRLAEIINEENKWLKPWIDKNYVAQCKIPALVKNDVHCIIAIVAEVSAGKSTLFNALCGFPILPVASKTTSSVPTYITRVKNHSQESVTVYGIKKEEVVKDGKTSIRFVRDTETGRTYDTKNITKEMFDELFEYMYFLIHGTELEYRMTIENMAYFMKTPEKADILFHGCDADKRTISREDFALSYDTPRHRFLLLLILLCAYIEQNESKETMSEYIKALNEQRTELLKKYGFPVGSDYCVCLDWCNEDIPENTTLIDLPGTGSSTEDIDLQSSHTALVRGILNEADAIWVLCSGKGTLDHDLEIALKDVIEGNSRKNKVCIYNCTNRRPHDSGPVIEFLKKLPCLTGERCYVVNALAGEYKYIQNGVNALLTRTASDSRENDDELTQTEITKKLKNMYSGEKKAYCTFTTSKDSCDNIIAIQDGEHKYTLDTFFKNVFLDYIERLKYEVALTKAIEQAKFYIYIRDSLFSSLGMLESVAGKDKDITKAVIESLSIAKREAIDNYVEEMKKYQIDLGNRLKNLGSTIENNINKEFIDSLSLLIESIKSEWKTLEISGHPNCLQKNFLGNYPLNAYHSNWWKFKKVRDLAEIKITISVFDDTLKIVDVEMRKYEQLLRDYTNDLKKVTCNFVGNYIKAFLVVFDKKCDELCKEVENVNKEMLVIIRHNFENTRKNFKNKLQMKLNELCIMVCESFDILTNRNGIFDKLCKETEDIFRKEFCDKILDGMRESMYHIFTNTNSRVMLVDYLKPEDLHKLLNDDFSQINQQYENKLSDIIKNIYGVGFPSNLSAKVNEFNNEKIVNGANVNIETMHDNILSLVKYASGEAVDLAKQIEELKKAIGYWKKIETQYKNIYAMLMLEESEGENTKNLYNDYSCHMEKIIFGTRKE